MDESFTLVIQSLRWNAYQFQRFETIDIEPEVQQRIGKEVREWYQSLDQHARRYVRTVTVSPVFVGRDIVDIDLMTGGLGGDSNLATVGRGNRQMQFNVKTWTTHPLPDEEGLKGCLSRALRSILSSEANLTRYVLDMLDKAVTAAESQ